jgi:tetratricopeptide (TPR) repeat protein
VNLGPAGRRIATTLTRALGRYQHRLAIGHAAAGDPEHAITHARRAATNLRRGRADLEHAAVLEVLGTCLFELGRLDEASSVLRRCVDVLDGVAPGSAQHVAATIRLGDLQRICGRFADAEALLTHAIRRTAPDPVSGGVPLRALGLNALGILYKDTARYDAAEHAYTEALGLITARTGSEDVSAAPVWHNFAGLAYARGQVDRAGVLAARAVELHEQHLGPDHHLVAQDLAVLGAALYDQGKVADAEPVFERALAIVRRRHPADQYEVAVNLANLAACRVARQRPADAEHLYRQALSIKEQLLGRNHPEVARQIHNLAIAVGLQERPDEASALQRRAIEMLERTLSDTHPLVACCRESIASGSL